MIRFGSRPASSTAILAGLTGANPLLLGDGDQGAPSYSWSAEPDSGLFRRTTGAVGITIAGTQYWDLGANVFKQRSTATLTWTSGTAASGSDLILARDAANTLAQRNGTSAQALRLYNTYTDALNYERAFLGWSSNILSLATEAAGSGSTNRIIQLNAQGTVIEVAPSGVTIARNSTSAVSQLEVAGGSLSSTAILHTRFRPVINQASGSYTVLDINPTETAVGAGPHYLIRGRIGAGSNVFSVDNNGNIFTQSVMQFLERTDPSAPTSNNAFLYCRDNGSGKTQLVARFPTGAVQVIATEP